MKRWIKFKKNFFLFFWVTFGTDIYLKNLPTLNTIRCARYLVDKFEFWQIQVLN